MIKTMEDAAALFKQPTAVECSFMAPGLGAWRPAMAPYVDEKDWDLVTLGLQWHPKMLIRTALSGVVINPYNTHNWTHPGNTEADLAYCDPSEIRTPALLIQPALSRD